MCIMRRVTQAITDTVGRRMFADRLEIENQGGLFGHLSEDNIGTVAPATRNAALMRMLEDMDIVENRGSGIRAMIESMRLAHLAPSEFKNTHTSFRVTFFNHTLLDKETVEWLNKFGNLPLEMTISFLPWRT